MAVTKSASEQLERLKKNVSTAYTYFLDNYRRYRDFRRYVFKENINEQQRTVLQQLNRPVVEFNVVEPSISMLLGEFSKQEPGIEVGPSEGVPVNQDVLNVVEGSIRHAIHSANKNSFSYEIYKDILSGGFSVARIRTDFSNPMSFSQDIFWEKEFDTIKPFKNKKGNRFYTQEDIDHIAMINHLVKERGYTLPGALEVLKDNTAVGDQNFEVIKTLTTIKNFLMELKEKI